MNFMERITLVRFPQVGHCALSIPPYRVSTANDSMSIDEKCLDRCSVGLEGSYYHVFSTGFLGRRWGLIETAKEGVPLKRTD
jgi:hypothetical protein